MDKALNLQEMLGLGRDLEVLFECSGTVWVVSGISNDNYLLLFPALPCLSFGPRKHGGTVLAVNSLLQQCVPMGLNQQMLVEPNTQYILVA